jgi:hypothetical protein
MSPILLQIVLFGAIALGLVLYIVDPAYTILLIKSIFALSNVAFAVFVFRHLLDMNNHYKSKLYPVLFIIGFGILILPCLILLNLFL